MNINANETNSLNTIPIQPEQELRHLLDTEIPEQISGLEEDSAKLQRVASYCEANYLQSAKKDVAFDETKKLCLQSLASVAYHISTLSSAILRSLDLEVDNLAEKTFEVKKLSKLIAIQKEKAARREIGKLTTNKAGLTRQNKITYPQVEERVPRYQRTPIDFSLLDGIGHGCREPSHYQQSSNYVPTGANLMRAGSITSSSNGSSAYSGGGAISGAQQQQNLNNYYHIHQQQPSNAGIYGENTTGYYGRLPVASVGQNRGTSTLTRNATLRTSALPPMTQPQRHPQQQYRAPSLAIDNGGIYRPAPALLAGDSRYSASSTISVQVNGNGNAGNVYGTLRRQPTQQQYQQQVHEQQPSITPSLTSTTLDGNSCYYSDKIDSGGSGSTGTLVNVRPNVIPGQATGGVQRIGGSNSNSVLMANHQFANATHPQDLYVENPPPSFPDNATVWLTTQQHQQQQQQQYDHDSNFASKHSTADVSAPSELLGKNNHANIAPTLEATIPNYVERAQALFEWKPQRPDELELYVGAIVYVLRKNDDGWYEGVMDGITGLFPGNYVQTI